MRVAPVAGCALFGMDDNRAFSAVKCQDSCWAEFNADAAAFAPLSKNGNDTARSFWFWGKPGCRCFWYSRFSHEDTPLMDLGRQTGLIAGIPAHLVYNSLRGKSQYEHSLVSIGQSSTLKRKAPITRAFKAGAEGFEPPHTDPESAVLPLDEAPVEKRGLFYHAGISLSTLTILFQHIPPSSFHKPFPQISQITQITQIENQSHFYNMLIMIIPYQPRLL